MPWICCQTWNVGSISDDSIVDRIHNIISPGKMKVYGRPVGIAMFNEITELTIQKLLVGNSTYVGLGMLDPSIKEGPMVLNGKTVGYFQQQKSVAIINGCPTIRTTNVDETAFTYNLIVWSVDLIWVGTSTPSYFSHALDRGRNSIGYRTTPWILLSFGETVLAAISVHGNVNEYKRKKLINSLTRDVQKHKDNRYVPILGGDWNEHAHNFTGRGLKITMAKKDTHWNRDPSNQFHGELDYFAISHTVHYHHLHVLMSESMEQAGHDHAIVTVILRV